MMAARTRTTRARLNLTQCTLFSIPVLVLLSTIVGSPSAAAAEELETRSYYFRRVQTPDGLPDSSVTAMTQTPDGYIWCATFNGLARFDGVHFEIFDPSNTPELPTDRLIRLGQSRSGALIIVTEFGDIVLFADGRFKRCASKRSHRYEAIVEDGQGRLWASSLRRTVSDWEPLDHDGNGGMQGPLRVALGLFYTNRGPCVVQGNTLLAWDELGLRKATAAGPWEPIQSPLPAGQEPELMAAAPNGAWLGSSNGWYFFDGESIKRSVPCSPRIGGPAVFCDQGPLWIRHHPALLTRVDLQNDTVMESFEVPGHNDAGVNVAFLDREQNLWVGMPGMGLTQVRRLEMKTFGVRDGLSNDIVHSVAEDAHGNIWVATTEDINIIANEHVSALPPSDRVLLPWAVVPARSGGMWVGSYSVGLFHFLEEQKQLVREVRCEPWESPHFTFLHEDSKGMLWFGNASGLFCFDGTNCTAVTLPVGSPPDMRALVEAPDGTLYAGSNGRGLFARNPQTKAWKQFARADGLRSEQIYSLHAEADGGLWIGTSGAGLARFDGRRFVFFNDLLKELPRTVTGMVSDELGYLWIGSASGVFRVRLADLNALAEDSSRDISIIEYGARAGLLRTESNIGIQPSILKAHDGRIWVATIGGVICFDPRKISTNPLPPPVLIERVRSEDSQIDLVANKSGTKANKPAVLSRSEKSLRTIVIQPGADPTEFDFTALSFTAPENVRFRYRMEGLDGGWTHTQDRHAVYQRLPPGHYTFHVTACNNSGVWNTVGATLAVIQLPFFWQTSWFKVSMVVLAAALFYAAYRFRLAQLARVGRLRARIAADLHDEVGGNLGAVVLNSNLLTVSPNLSASEREQAEDIHRVARNTAHAIREISWFINPDFDFLDEMIVRMKEAAGRLSGNCEVRFVAPPAPPKTRLGLEFRRNVMALFKESLNNAARHSGAKHIDVSVGLSGGRLELLIRDDGRGFEVGHENGGQGLRNLRQRAQAIHGTLDIKSSAAEGTRIQLSADLQ